MNKSNYDSIVVFNEVKHGSLVVFIHPIGGQLYWYKDIINNLSKDIPIYGFISQGLLNKCYAYHSLEGMAQYYLDNILDKPKREHYVIVGWSYGCEVAYEIAKYLTSLKYHVSIIILDPQVMIESSKNIAAYFCEVLEKEYQLPLSNSQIEYIDIDLNTMDQFIINFVDQMVAAKKIKELYKTQYFMSMRVYLYNLMSFCQYKREGYIDRITLMQCTNQRNALSFSFLRQAAASDWRAHAQQLKNITVDGDHYTMLQEESALSIASVIRENIIG